MFPVLGQPGILPPSGFCPPISRKRSAPAALWELLSSAIHIGLLGALIASTFVRSVSAQSGDPRQLFQEAQAAQQRGDAQQAARKYQELIRLHPEMTAAHANLGVVLVSLGRYDEAVEQYRAALKQAPENRALQFNLALAYYKKGDLAQAGEQFQSLLHEDPGNTRIAMLLSDCYMRLGGHDAEIISMLTPLEKAQSGNLDIAWLLGAALIRAGRTREGLERVEKVAKQKHLPAAFLLAAEAELRMEKFDEARHDLEEARRLNPHLPGLDTLSGMIYDFNGDTESAAKAFEAALKVNSQDFQAHLHLGAILFVRRQLEPAKQHLARALELQPNSSVARYELARVESAQGDSAAAVRELERVVREDPEWLPPHVQLATLYFKLKRPEDGLRERKIVDRLSAEARERQTKTPRITPTLPSH